MKKEFLGAECYIDTKRHYPIRELFELMRENLEDKFGTIIIKKALLLGEEICVQSVDGYINIICSIKNRIIIRQEKAKPGFFDFIPVLDDILEIFNLQGTKGSRAFMKALGEEIERLIANTTFYPSLGSE